jgi:hypothetical protein
MQLRVDVVVLVYGFRVMEQRTWITLGSFRRFQCVSVAQLKLIEILNVQKQGNGNYVAALFHVHVVIIAYGLDLLEASTTR